MSKIAYRTYAGGDVIGPHAPGAPVHIVSKSNVFMFT